MAALDFPQETFDLVWSEGAAYVMGVPKALQAWRPLLREQGYLAFSELVWLDEHPPAEVAEYFLHEYPAMTSIQSIRESICAHGYEPVGDFTLPDSAWWDDYYTPLEAKLPSLRQKYAGDEEALGVIFMSEVEIEMRRRFGQSYGYHFFVARKIG
jgi:SAM-dependent methyltransferase